MILKGRARAKLTPAVFEAITVEKGLMVEPKVPKVEMVATTVIVS